MDINWKNVCKKVVDFTVTTFTLGLTYGLMFASPRKVMVDVENDHLAASYGTAVKTIMESDMLDSRKRDAIGSLDRDGDSGYYEAVISIVNSDMLDSRKVDTIRIISDEEF